MNKIKKMIALTAMMSLFASQVQAQQAYSDTNGGSCDDSCAAYCDSENASYWSAALPIGAIAVAAIIIATTDRHHHHHSSSNSSNSSSSSSSNSSHFHSHSGG